MFPSPPAPCRPLLFSVCAVLLACACSAQAGTGDVIRTPPPSVRNTTGIALEVDTQWVDASGYRVVRIHVATAGGGPSPSDRNLLVELLPSNNNMKEGTFIASRSVTLPQGASSVTERIFVPQNQPWYQLGTRVTLDGRTSDLHSTKCTLKNNAGGEWSEAVPAILVIDADAPSLLDRHKRLVRFNRNSRGMEPQTTLADIRALEMLVNRAAYGGFDERRPRDL